MSIDEQVRIMEAQLSAFNDSLLEKMQYMSFAFDPDPVFCKAARDIVRCNISKALGRK